MKSFNIAGPCDPREHYMLPPEIRLPIVRQLVEEKGYFTVHAARQVGKTTLFRALSRSLLAEGRFAPMHVSCEAAQAAGGDIEKGIPYLIEAIGQAALIHLPPQLRRPPTPASVSAPASSTCCGAGVKSAHSRWCFFSTRSTR